MVTNLRRGRRALTASTLVAIGVFASTSPAPAEISPFRAVGPIELGMTRASVERVLGRPEATAYRVRLLGQRTRSQYIEYEYLMGRWTIGFEGLRGNQRVVKVEYSGTRHRISARLRVGSRIRDIVREFPDAVCEDRVRGSVGRRTIVVDDRRSGRRMLFHIAYESVPSPPPGEVVSISVQNRLRYARPYRAVRCFAGWRTR